MSYKTYHDILIEELERRKKLNSSYSLRAYSRDLNISAPRLSQVLNRKQGLSVEMAGMICQRLKLNAEQTQWFCHSVGALHARSQHDRMEFSAKVEAYKKEQKNYPEIHLEYFKVISDWYYFALLELTHLSDFKNDHGWIAEMLGITELEVAAAIERMIGLNLLEEKNGTLIDCFKCLATPNDIPSQALREFNSQLMKKAMESLDRDCLSQREISSNVFSMKKEDVPKFKLKLREFRREFSSEANQGTQKDSVYCLGVQFFELTPGSIQ